MALYASRAGLTVVQAPPSERAAFIRRTYVHLAGAILAFVGLEMFLVNGTNLARTMLEFIGGSRYGWLMILGGFMVAGWMARNLASNVRSVPIQYLGLAVYVVIEAIIFLPLLYIAAYYSKSPDLIPMAAILTLLLFAGLTVVAFTSGTDFSFLRGALTIGGFIAIGLIVCATIFGFHLGLLFSVGMVILAGAAILYDTSRIIHYYPPDMHVAASLQLFASIALLFWYILRILMGTRR